MAPNVIGRRSSNTGNFFDFVKGYWLLLTPKGDYYSLPPGCYLLS